MSERPCQETNVTEPHTNRFFEFNKFLRKLKKKKKSSCEEVETVCSNCSKHYLQNIRRGNKMAITFWLMSLYMQRNEIALVSQTPKYILLNYNLKLWTYIGGHS